MASIIGFVCFAALIVLFIFVLGDNGQGGNDWIEIYKEIKKKTRRR